MTRLIRIFAAVLALGCADCRMDRSAGTSTSVGDTADGVAVLADGKPASGALVCARSGSVEFPAGIPQSSLLDSVRADADGGFRIDPQHLAGSFYLEILCDAAALCAASGGEVYFGMIKAAPDLIGREFRLSPPGSLLAKARWTRIPDSLQWVGLRGTARFMKPVVVPGPDGSVSGEALFEGLGPGDYDLIGCGKDGSGSRTRPVRINAGRLTEIGLP